MQTWSPFGYRLSVLLSSSGVDDGLAEQPVSRLSFHLAINQFTFLTACVPLVWPISAIVNIVSVSGIHNVFHVQSNMSVYGVCVCVCVCVCVGMFV